MEEKIRRISSKDIRRALAEVDCSTARSRRILDGREIDVEPTGETVSEMALRRCRLYLSIASDLRGCVESNCVGISDKELENVEFIIEQLEGASRVAHEQSVRTY